MGLLVLRSLVIHSLLDSVDVGEKVIPCSTEGRGVLGDMGEKPDGDNIGDGIGVTLLDVDDVSLGNDSKSPNSLSLQLVLPGSPEASTVS